MSSTEGKNQDEDDVLFNVFLQLKILGLKIPKLKKFKINVLKSEKPVQESNCKIFGVYLSDQEWVSNGKCYLPKFLAISTAYLESFSKYEIGLFRKTGNVARQKRLRRKLEDGGNLDDSEPNDVASLLKQWLRELPESLIPPYLQDLFTRCLNLEIEENCITACLLICLLLSPEQLHTLKYLLNFLADISSNSDFNKMDSYNLALIMAPNIFVSNESPDKSRKSIVEQHTSILKKLIENCNKVGEIPPGVTFQCPITSSELDSSSDVLDSNANEPKKKVRSGLVQEIFLNFKKFVGQNNTPLSKNVTLEPYTNSSVNSPCKRKIEPELHLPSVKRQAVSKEDLDDYEQDVTPKRNGLLINRRAKTPRSHVQRKSLGSLLRRKVKKSDKSNKLPSKECQLYLSIASAIVNILHINPSLEATTSTETKSICESGYIKKSLSKCSLPTFSTGFSILPIISAQSSEGSLSSQTNEPSLHHSNSENFANNKNVLFEKYVRKHDSENKNQKNVLEEISKEETLLNAIVPVKLSKNCSSSNLVNRNCLKNENRNLETNINFVSCSSVLRSPLISSSDLNEDLLSTHNLVKENIFSEVITLERVGFSRQEAFIKYKEQKSSKPISGLESSSNRGKKLSPKPKECEKRNSFNYSSFKEVNTKQENKNNKIARSPLCIKNTNSPFITTQKQELECSLFKTPNNKCNSPNSEVWLSGSTLLNTIASSPEKICNKRGSINRILKHNTGHVQAKVNLYDNNIQSSGSKDCFT